MLRNFIIFNILMGLTWAYNPRTADALTVASFSQDSTYIIKVNAMKNLETVYGYIYMTINLINGKKYVGQRKKNKLDLSYCGTGVYLKKAVNKYGRENFINGIIEYCESFEELNKKEKYWIKFHETMTPCGYNLTEGGEGISKYKHTKETISKISKSGKIAQGSLKARALNRERQIKRLTDPIERMKHKAVQNRPDVKLKISKSQIKRMLNPKNRERISKSLTGRHLSEETKNKISKGTSGVNNPMFEKKQSKEAKEKISKANKGNKAWNKGKIGPIVKCPYCGKSGYEAGMKSHHFKNCKFKI